MLNRQKKSLTVTEYVEDDFLGLVNRLLLQTLLLINHKNT